MNKKYDLDMIHGPIMPRMIAFFLPLMFSSILQLLFNAADLMVVGRFTGSDALAAVGSTSSLIHMVVNLFVGISMGANVQTAKCIARGDRKMIQETVDTSITTALISGVVMMVTGGFCARAILRLMNTPAEIIGLSDTYLKIYFLGTPFFMLYNFGAAILRASGDTKRPMYFLIVAGALNLALNLLLVIVFKLGVIGVAAATVFSQFVSSVLVVRVLCRGSDLYTLDFKKLHINRDALSCICRVGIPTGLQSVVISFSNVLLQSSVNSLGTASMAGYTAANNIQSFAFITVNSISQACMTFTSQNYAINDMERVRKVIRTTFLLDFIIGFSVGCFGTVLGPQILAFFSEDREVINLGMQIIPQTLLLYFICGFMDGVPAALRGLGHAAMPMLLSILGTVGTRIIWIFFIFPLNRTLSFLFWSYPVSWTVTVIMQLICLVYVFKKIQQRTEYETNHT